jgi:outer membrane protein
VGQLQRYGLIGLLWLLPAMATVAQTVPDNLKIGVVNAARLLDEAPQAEQARKRLEQEFQPRDRSVLQIQREMRELEDRLLADRTLALTETDRRELERELRERRRELKRSEDELREDFNIRRNEELNRLQQQIFEAIVGLARSQQFDLILNQDAVIFAGERVDITSEVLLRLQEEQ